MRIRDINSNAADGTVMRIGKCIALASLLTLSACSEPDVDAVAKVSHDFNGNFELYSYQAKPQEDPAQAEKLAQKQYGSLAAGLRSPETIFMCVWRDPKTRRSKNKRPTEIFLSYSFASKPVKNPKSLIKMAEIYNKIDRANLKAGWKLKNGKYQLSRFEVEILADRKSYRSQNLAAEMKQIEVEQGDMVFPDTANDTFQFSLKSSLPHRQNSKDKQRKPIVNLTFSGVAEPIPNWVNY